MTETNQNKTSEILDFLNEVVLVKEIEVFHHQPGHTWVRTIKESNGLAIDSPLFSRQFISWLTNFVYRETGHFITFYHAAIRYPPLPLHRRIRGQ